MGYSRLAKQMAFRLNAIVLVKIMGFLGRIPFYRILGAEGVGLYQIAYSFYGLIFTGITGGFPTALALTTSRNRVLGRKLFRILLYFSIILGGATSLLVFLFAPYVANTLGNPELAFAVRCISPAVAVVPLLFVLRGYLQGLEFYSSIAASEFIEQAARIGILIFLTALWSQFGIPIAVGGAVIGAFSGACSALLFLCAVFIYHSKPSFPKMINSKSTLSSIQSVTITRKDLKLFIITSLAISATRIIVPLSDFLDSIIIPFRLQASGLSYHDAIAVFGEITGMATTIVYLPTVLTGVVSYTLSTKVAADWKENNKERFLYRSRMALELTWLWGIGTSLFLCLYAEPLSVLLFDHAGASRAIRYLSVIPFFVGIRELTTTLLWSMNLKGIPINGLLLGVIISLFTVFYLSAIPGFGYRGAAIGILLLEITAASWNFMALKKQFISLLHPSALFIDTLTLIIVIFLLYGVGKIVTFDFIHPRIHMLFAMALTLSGIVIIIIRRKRLASFI